MGALVAVAAFAQTLDLTALDTFARYPNIQSRVVTAVVHRYGMNFWVMKPITDTWKATSIAFRGALLWKLVAAILSLVNMNLRVIYAHSMLI